MIFNTYVIPLGKTLKIMVRQEQIDQLQQNLANYRIEHNELKMILNPTPSDYYMMLLLEAWENETRSDLCLIDHSIKMIDKGLAVL